MDYNNEQAKVPFYMTFPMQNLYLMEMEYEKDMERMKSLYPKEVQKLMPHIERYCDKLEYEGSRIYDENPDAMMMAEEAAKLYEVIRQELEKEAAEEQGTSLNNRFPMEDSVQVKDGNFPDNMESMEVREPGPVRQCSAFSLNPPEGLIAPSPRTPALAGMDRRHHPNRPDHRGCDGWLCNMVGVLFQDEIYRRRCRNRRCRRWW